MQQKTIQQQVDFINDLNKLVEKHGIWLDKSDDVMESFILCNVFGKEISVCYYEFDLSKAKYVISVVE